MTKAIIFDLDDTLYRIEDSFKYAVKASVPNFDLINISTLYKHFRHYSNKYFESSQSGLISMEYMRKTRFIEAMSHFNIVIDDAQAVIFQKNYSELVYNTPLSSEVVEILEFLKSNNVPRGIITNGESKHQWRKINMMGLTKYFDPEYIIVSGDFGIDKPDIRIFKEMEGKFPKKMTFLYVGDSYDNDIVGSYESGWENIWLTDSNANLPYVGRKVSNISEIKTTELYSISWFRLYFIPVQEILRLDISLIIVRFLC